MDKPVSSWTVDDIRIWLEGLNCGNYFKLFVDNHITPDLLLECNQEVLKSLGIVKVGDRIRINQGLNRLRSKSFSQLPSLSQLNRDVISPFLIFQASSPGVEGGNGRALRRQASTLSRAQGSGGATSSSAAPTPTISTANSVHAQHVYQQTQPSQQQVYQTSGGSHQKIQSMDVVKQNNLKFIYPEGHMKTVNIAGCTGAEDIKRRAIQKHLSSAIGGAGTITPINTDKYVIYIFDEQSGTVRKVLDWELTEISQSPDKAARRRLIICEKDRVPSAEQLSKSRQQQNQYLTHQGQQRDSYFGFGSLEDDDEIGQFLSPESRKYSEPVRRSVNASDRISGKRPPSEHISSHLAQFFPSAKTHELEQTVRNSIRFSKRLSRLSRISSRNSTSSSVWRIREDEPPPVPSLPTDADTLKDISTLVPQPRMSSVSATERESFTDQSSRLSALSRRLSNLRFSKVSSAVSKGPSSSDSTNEDTEVENKIIIPKRSSSESKGTQYYESVEISDSGSDSDDSDKVDNEQDFLQAISCPSKWIKGKLIGSGSFGTVYLGMNSLTGELMAVKQVELPSDSSSDQRHKKSMVDALEREMNLLKELEHENIVQYLGSNSEENVLNIFLEYVAGGSVASMLSTYGVFEEELISNFVKQILTGLNYLHSQHIIHRDIKGANVLVDDKGRVKISDFGISKKIETELQSHRVSLQGSVFWMAPEVVKQKPYTYKADIWSLGCLIVEMFTGQHPFPEFTQMQAIFRIGNSGSPAIPEKCSEAATEFLKSTFAIDPDERPTAAALLQHKFLDASR